MTQVPYGCDNQNLANVKSVKNYLLRASPENVKGLSSILTNIWRLEATYAIRFGTTFTLICRQSTRLHLLADFV